MWEVGNQEKTNIHDYNSELKAIMHDMDEMEAKITLAKFLRKNIRLTFDLLTGMEMMPVQEIIIKSILARDNGIIIMGRGASKTLRYTNDQKILVEGKGLLGLIDAFPSVDFSQGERWTDIPDTRVWNGKSYVKISKLLIQPNKQTIKIKTRFGYEIECAKTHIIKGINGKNNNSNIVWKNAGDLRNGDFLAIDRNEIKTEDRKEFSNLNEEEKEAYLVGLLFGDGCFSGSNIRITSMDDHILDFIKTFPSGKVGYQYLNGVEKKAKYVGLTVEYSNYLRNKYGFNNETSYFKKFPKLSLIHI